MIRVKVLVFPFLFIFLFFNLDNFHGLVYTLVSSHCCITTNEFATTGSRSRKLREREHYQLVFLLEKIPCNFVFEEPKERWRLEQGKFDLKTKAKTTARKANQCCMSPGKSDCLHTSGSGSQFGLEWCGFKPKFLLISKISTHCKTSEAVLAISQLFCQLEVTSFDFDHQLCNALLRKSLTHQKRCASTKKVIPSF